MKSVKYKNGIWRILGTNGKFYKEIYKLEEDYVWMIMDYRLKSYIGPIKNKNGEWGFIDENGKFIKDPIKLEDGDIVFVDEDGNLYIRRAGDPLEKQKILMPKSDNGDDNAK